jgi:hypothetical protein
MLLSNVIIGSGPGANDGESIYSAFNKVNQNFANVQSNVNALTNSVSSVAGRTGNVTLTINDIVGLNASYAINANVTQANLGMKGYVDSVASQSIYGNANVASFLPTYSGNLKAKYATFTGDNITGLNSLSVGISGIETFSNVVAQFHSNLNYPLHVAVHNKNTGSLSTSGFIATADIGDENEYLSLMGIVGSNWNPPGGHFLKPLESAMLAVGGNLVLGAATFSGVGVPTKDIVFIIGSGPLPEQTIETLRINATDDLLSANLELGANVGIKFTDSTRQTTAWTGAYTANSASSWNGAAPTTIASALDRLAILLKSLNGGTGA